MKLMDSGWSRKFDSKQFQILDVSILGVDNKIVQFQKIPFLSRILDAIVCVICKWSHPPSLLSLVLSIMIMGFRDRDVIAVKPVLSKQKHKCHTARLLQIHPLRPTIRNFHEYQEFQFCETKFYSFTVCSKGKLVITGIGPILSFKFSFPSS